MEEEQYVLKRSLDLINSEEFDKAEGLLSKIITHYVDKKFEQ